MFLVRASWREPEGKKKKKEKLGGRGGGEWGRGLEEEEGGRAGEQLPVLDSAATTAVPLPLPLSVCLSVASTPAQMRQDLFPLRLVSLPPAAHRRDQPTCISDNKTEIKKKKNKQPPSLEKNLGQNSTCSF